MGQRHTGVPLYPEISGILLQVSTAHADRVGQERQNLSAAGAGPYLRDLPKANLHLLDTGHFALEDKLDVMAPIIHQLLDRSIASK